jgi:hypothetical protein
MLFRLLTFAALIGIIFASALGQVLYELTSPNEEAYGQFGWAVSGAGDVNGDGYDDVIVGALRESPSDSPSEAGRAYVFSGATGSVLLTLVSPNEEEDGQFGRAVSSAGDVNGDGYGDVIVGAHFESPGSSPFRAGRAYVFAGFTGDLLFTLISPNDEYGSGYFGWAVSNAGDLNSDGLEDVIVGAPRELFAPMGRAHVFSGATGNLMLTLVSPDAEGGLFGCSVASTGDVNNDGCDDLLVGAYYDGIGGRVYIFSGATGEALLSLASPNEEIYGYFGFSVSAVGDLDNEGYLSVIAGAQGEDPGSSPNNAGRAYMFSGANGDLLFPLVSPSEEEHGLFGFSVSGVGDMDNDGWPDVVVGAWGENPYPSPEKAGRAYVFSGGTGNLIFTLVSPSEQDEGHFGCSVSGAGDVNRDGYADIIIGARGENLGGRAYVFSGILIPVELSLFEAESIDEGVLIRWRTETENQCFGFHLYRQYEADDTRRKVTAQIIPGCGSSTVPRDYSYLDPITEPGIYRYWLEEVAEDGKRTEFGPVEVTIHPMQLALRGPYPNPVRDKTELQLLIPETVSGPITLDLLDLRGRRIGRTIKRNATDDMTIEWNTADSDLASGVYWWRLEAGTEVVLRPMVVVGP